MHAIHWMIQSSDHMRVRPLSSGSKVMTQVHPIREAGPGATLQKEEDERKARHIIQDTIGQDPGRGHAPDDIHTLDPALDHEIDLVWCCDVIPKMNQVDMDSNLLPSLELCLWCVHRNNHFM